MIGMSRETGKHIDDREHLRQSIVDILTTPIGSRVMQPAYGSRLFELLDAPLNDFTQSDFIQATIEALATWEPRLKINSVGIKYNAQGEVNINLSAIYTPTGETVGLENISV